MPETPPRRSATNTPVHCEACKADRCRKPSFQVRVSLVSRSVICRIDRLLRQQQRLRTQINLSRISRSYVPHVLLGTAPSQPVAPDPQEHTGLREPGRQRRG